MTHIIDNSVDEIIEQLSPLELKILYACGRMDDSVHKNVRLEKLRKKVPHEDHKEFPKAIKSLKSKGLITVYRNKNFSIPKKSMVVCHELVKRNHALKYNGINIINLVV